MALVDQALLPAEFLPVAVPPVLQRPLVAVTVLFCPEPVGVELERRLVRVPPL